jgi:hypothetical protein
MLAWTQILASNGVLEGMKDNLKAIGHRAFGYRTA